MVSTHFCQKTKQSDPKVGSHHHNDVVMKLSWTWRLMFRFSAVLVTICAISNLGDCAWKSLNLTCFAKWRFLKVKSDFFLPTKVLKHKVSCFGPCDSLCTKTCFQKQFETTKIQVRLKKRYHEPCTVGKRGSSFKMDLFLQTETKVKWLKAIAFG